MPRALSDGPLISRLSEVGADLLWVSSYGRSRTNNTAAIERRVVLSLGRALCLMIKNIRVFFSQLVFCDVYQHHYYDEYDQRCHLFHNHFV